MKKYWIWPKMCNSYWKSMEILNGKEIRSIWAKFYYKQSASLFMQCVKLSFMIEDFEKWREVMALNFLNLVLQRYWKSLENEFEKCVGTLILDTFSTQRSPIHRVQMHGAWNRATHLYPPHNNSISSSDNNNIHAAHWADHQWNAEWAGNPTRLRTFIRDTGALPLGMTLPRKACIRLNRLRTGDGRFRSCLYKWGMASSAACECGAEEQTVDHVLLQCPIHGPPHGLHCLTVLDDETIEWLFNTCFEI